MNFHELDELVFDTRYVRALDGSIFPGVTPDSEATVAVVDADTTNTRTVYDAPNAGANVVPQPLHTISGRLRWDDGSGTPKRVYVAGETAVDLVVNGGDEPDGYTQRWTPPQVGGGGPGGSLLAGQYSLADYPRIDPEVDDSGRLARVVQDIIDDGRFETGAEILVEYGYYEVAQLPSLMGATDIVFRGVGGRGPGDWTASNIHYTGTDPNRAWDLRGSYGVRFVDVMLTYGNTAFTGKFIDYSHSAGTTPANRDSAFSSIERCTIKGLDGVDNAAALISFDNSHSHTLYQALLENAQCLIKGRDDVNHYSNAITLVAVHTAKSHQAPIRNAGEGWVAISPVGEPLLGGVAGWYDSDFPASGLTVDGGWFGDSNGTGWWVKYWGAGLQMRGTYFGGANGVSFGVGSSGCSVEGAAFVLCTKAFDLAAGCNDMRLWPNTYNTVGTKITTADTPPRSILPTNAGGVVLSGVWGATALEADQYLAAYVNTANMVILGRVGPGVAGPGVAFGPNLDVAAFWSSAGVLVVQGAGAATKTKHVIKAFGAQGDNLSEWQDTGGGVLLKVTSAGLIDHMAKRAINAADPTAATDLATKQYVDSVAVGLQQHAAVRAASVVNQALGAQGSRTVDGVACAAGDRVLLKAQTTASENGIYIVNADFSLSRAADGAQGSLKGAATVWVNEGTTNVDTAWTLTTDDPINVGATAQTWTQSNALGQVVAGAGLTKTGAQLDIGAGANIQVNADTIQVAPSPAFTGTPTAPTPTAGDASTKLATTAFVNGAWTAFPYNTTDWQDVGGSDQVVQYKVTGNGDVKLRGSAQSKAGRTITFGLPGTGTTIGTLPAGARPPKTVTLFAYANDAGTGGLGKTVVAITIAASGVMTVLSDLTGRALARTDPFYLVFDGSPAFSTLA